MQSMTGFASASGEEAGRRWRIEAKSVNGRGLDLRFRLAEGYEHLEPALRAAGAKALSRGNVSVALRSEDDAESGALALNAAALSSVIAAAAEGEEKAKGAGLSVAPTSIGALLAIRGVLESARPVAGDALDGAVKASFANLLEELIASRAEEGTRIAAALAAQVDEIEKLSGQAAEAFADHQAGASDRLKEKIAAIDVAGGEVNEDRLAQELALLAVKADIREELDRLDAHIAAARDLIAAPGPVGRKLDFLTQEFNREVNTLCSKSASSALTSIGLALKVVVDQMREQAQNVE